ncbi:MAG: hypothetical protein JXC32_00900 [Anaerolineae bacterium]|nr:hypothetical protein [Anaerolineae bacterium]
MTQEARARSKNETQRAQQAALHAERPATDRPGPASHPLLDLQRLVGNHAVQQLVAQDGPRGPATVQRAVLQRILSPSTAAMGRLATGDLLSSWARAHLSVTDAANQLNAANTAVFDLLQPITLVQATLAVAEREPAPGGGSVPVAPVTPTPVPVPSPTPETER